MVKVTLLDKTGKAKSDIALPKNFEVTIREDLIAKVFEAQKLMHMQSYGAKEGAGAQYSASGISKKKRHDWKGTYGKGISRIPRKIMSRHGASFNWIGATVSSTRGGRRPHAPRAAKNPFKKINKKELKLAFDSALTGTVNAKVLEKKYHKKVPCAPVFDKAILDTKTKDFIKALQKAFGDAPILKKKRVRAGKGTMRGRKYKSNAGLLFIVGNSESMKRSGLDVIKVKDLHLKDLSPNGKAGRLACYTESAIKDIEKRFK